MRYPRKCKRGCIWQNTRYNGSITRELRYEEGDMEFKISSEDNEVLEESQENPADGMDEFNEDPLLVNGEPLIIEHLDGTKQEPVSGNILADRKSINIFMIISAVLLLIALFLPYVKINVSIPDSLMQEVEQSGGELQTDAQIYTETVSLLGTAVTLYGILLLGCSIAQIVFAALKKNRLMKIGSAVVVVIIGRLIFRYFLSDTVVTDFVKIQVGSGFVLLIISGIAMLLSAFYRDYIGKPNVNED